LVKEVDSVNAFGLIHNTGKDNAWSVINIL
jgi:hypothetical protein